MKKILSLILVFAGLFVLGINGVKANNEYSFIEDFSGISNTESSYKAGSFLGINNIEWNYLGRTDQTLDGNALTFGADAQAFLESNSISGGIDSFSIDVKNTFSGNADRKFKIEIIQDNKTIKTFEFISLSTDVQTFTIDSIGLTGDFIIRITNTGALRITIDNIKWNANSLKYPVNIDILLDSENVINLNEQMVEYSGLLNLEAIYQNYNFAFWVLNGFVRSDLSLAEQSFIVNGPLNIQQVFYPEGKHAVLFMDTNGKLIKVQYVLDGEAAIAPSVEGLSKPGYILNQENPWLDHKGLNTLENINYSRVYTLQYEKTNNDVFTITVDGVDATYEYNELATITSEDPLFTHWESEGRVVSTNRTYTFTVVENKVFTAKTTVIEAKTRVIMTNDLKVRENYQTFIAQIDLLNGETIVENGYILLEDGLQKNNPLTLESKDVIKVQSNVLNKATNEFTYSFQEKYAVVRAYVVTKDAEGKLNTYYSENQYSNGVVVTLDIDGKIEQSFHLLGTIFAQPVQPSKDRMNFAGWFVGEEEFNFATELSKDITIEAKFTEPTDEQKVQYAKEDLLLDTEDYRNINLVTSGTYEAVITWVSSDINVIDNNGQLINRPADADVVITLTATITVGEFTEVKEFTVLVPKAVGLQWTVSFDTNGANLIDSQIVDDGALAIEPEQPIKDNSEFLGWFDVEGNEYDFNSPVTEDIVIYAKWSKAVYTATIQIPTGATAGAIQTVTASSINLNPDIFSVAFTNNTAKNGLYIGNPMRFYAGTKTVISIDTKYVITKIIIGAVSQSGNNSNLIYTGYSGKIVSEMVRDNLNIESFTIDSISQTRITQIDIEYQLK